MTANSKKIGAALAGVLLVTAGFLVVPSLLERKTEKRVTEFLQSIPGDIRAKSVNADFWNGEIVLQGVSGAGKRPDGGDFTFEAGEIRARDVGIGPDPLIGLLRAGNLNIRSHIPVPGTDGKVTHSLTIADLSLRDISGDPNRLLRSCDAGQAECLDAVAAFRIGDVAMNGYAADTGTDTPGSARITVDSFTGRDMSLQSTGPFELRGFKIGVFGMDIASMERMRAASASGPNMRLYAEIMRQTHDEYTIVRALVKALETNPVVLRGMECEGISLPLNFPADKRITIAGTVADWTLDTNRAMLRVALSGLTVPSEMLRRHIPYLGDFARIYGKNLHLEAVLDLAGALQGKSGDFTVNRISLADPALASFESSGAFAFTVERGKEGLEGLLLFGAELFLKNFRLALEDINLVNVWFAAGEDKSSPRAAAVAMVRELAADESGEYAARVLYGLAQLVAAPGKLTVAVNPPVPLPISPDILSDRGTRYLNSDISVEYTPR
jgi:hypothetical protein